METLNNMHYTVCAVILTYNRKDLLDKCITSLLNQSYKLNQIIIIDNCSNDGTDEVLKRYIKHYRNEITWKKLDKNYGASYGFNKGIKGGYLQGSDFIWIMDDDTIPDQDALKHLIEKIDLLQDSNLGFLSSDIRWIDGSPCKMNIPAVHNLWNEKIKNYIIRLSACSFVSVLFPRNVVKKVGLPISDFYIWSTDVEYTSRITKYYDFNGYFVIDSHVVHAMKINEGADILRDDGSRIDRFKYDYRNRMYLARKEGKVSSIKFFIRSLHIVLLIMRSKKSYRLKRIGAVLSGTIKGLFFNPKIEYVEN